MTRTERRVGVRSERRIGRSVRRSVVSVVGDVVHMRHGRFLRDRRGPVASTLAQSRDGLKPLPQPRLRRVDEISDPSRG